MTIEMPRGLPFSVDTFGPYTTTKRRKRHHFLTHAHKDHTVGISSSNVVFPIYSTSLTISLLLQRDPQLDESFFARIEVGQSVIVDDPDGEFKVTAFDANHCPGAVMFLFEGSFGNILHTGDCRLSRDCLQSLPEKYVARRLGGEAPKCCLDYIFLDCTFGKSSHRFPTKHSAIRQVINCIWNHPDAPVVYLACDMLGQEEVLLEISRTFGSKIYVNQATNFECFRSLMAIVPEIVSEDPSSRFHIFSAFPKLYERASAKFAEARSKLQNEPLIIRPSSQWYVFDDENYSQCRTQTQKQRKVRFSEAVKDEFGIWHVCYSMHSSREELELALQLLSPKWVVSTVPSCRAMELDYVKKNCFISRFSADDPFWKLLDISIGDSPVAAADTHTLTLSCCLMSEELNLDSANPKLEPVIELSSTKKKVLSLSPEKCLPVTLFGRPRLVSQESNQTHEKKPIQTQRVFTETSLELKKVNRKEVVESLEDGTKEETMEKESRRSFSASSSQKETCKDLSGDLRKLYRSMNAPVPRPLPSLMELMNARKRSRNHLSF